MMVAPNRQAVKSLKWSAIERFLTQGLQFVLMLLIARMVSPEAFGLIGMLTIFIAIAQTFADSGFASALIRKGYPTEIEYSTAFFTNVVIGIVGYGVIYLIAPMISVFYEEPILTNLVKLVGLNVLFNSLAIVPRAKLIIELNFKRQALISLISVIVSGSIGVYMAYHDYGAWALAWQTLTMTVTSTILLWLFGRWLPLYQFDYQVFKGLFNYGSKLLLSSLLETVYKNLTTLVVGKQFNAGQLGLYTQANKLAELSASNITFVIQRVNFPLMSRVGDDRERLKSAFTRAIAQSAFVIFPVMGGLSVLSEPLIEVLLGNSWAGVAPFLQVLCVSAMFYPWHAINLNLLQVKGRSDLFLKLEIIKKINFTIMLLITSSISVYAMCLGIAFCSLISVFINSYYTDRFLRLSFREQLSLIIPTLISTLLACVFTKWLLLNIELYAIYELFIGIVVGVVLYVIASLILSPTLSRSVYTTVIRMK